MLASLGVILAQRALADDIHCVKCTSSKGEDFLGSFNNCRLVILPLAHGIYICQASYLVEKTQEEGSSATFHARDRSISQLP